RRLQRAPQGLAVEPRRAGRLRGGLGVEGGGFRVGRQRRAVVLDLPQASQAALAQNQAGVERAAVWAAVHWRLPSVRAVAGRSGLPRDDPDGDGDLDRKQVKAGALILPAPGGPSTSRRTSLSFPGSAWERTALQAPPALRLRLSRPASG